MLNDNYGYVWDCMHSMTVASLEMPDVSCFLGRNSSLSSQNMRDRLIIILKYTFSQNLFVSLQRIVGLSCVIGEKDDSKILLNIRSDIHATIIGLW